MTENHAVQECVGDRLAIGPKPTWAGAGISYDCFVNKRFRVCSLDQQFLLPPSLQDWLPEDHLARFVADVMNELDLSPIYAKHERRDGRGLSAYHPLLLARLLLYGFMATVYGSTAPGRLRKQPTTTWRSAISPQTSIRTTIPWPVFGR